MVSSMGWGAAGGFVGTKGTEDLDTPPENHTDHRKTPNNVRGVPKQAQQERRNGEKSTKQHHHTGKKSEEERTT